MKLRDRNALLLLFATNTIYYFTHNFLLILNKLIGSQNLSTNINELLVQISAISIIFASESFAILAIYLTEIIIIPLFNII